MDRSPVSLGIAALAMLLSASCSTRTNQAGGLEVILDTDMATPADFDVVHVEIQQEAPDAGWGPALLERNYTVGSNPGDRESDSEIQLPTTISIAAGKSPYQEVLITVSAFRSTMAEPLVERVVQTQVPTDRVAELKIELAKICAGRATSCSVGDSCQPDTGNCGSNVVEVATLPPYSAADIAEAGTPTTVSADSGSPEAADGAADGPTFTRALLIDDQSSSIGQISLPNGGFWNTIAPDGSLTPPHDDPFVFTPVNATPGISQAACFSGTMVTPTVHASGTEFFEFQLPANDGTLTPYDASAYSGVAFYIMSPDIQNLDVYFLDTNNEPYSPGATCAGGADAGPVPTGGYPAPPCGNPTSTAIAVSADWHLQYLPFSAFFGAFSGDGYSPPQPLDTHGMVQMGFSTLDPIPGIDGGPGPPFSLHVCVAQIYFTQ